MCYYRDMNDNIPNSKICTGCSEDKLLEDFGNHKKGKYGKRQKCKACTKGLNDTYYEKNAEKVRARERWYRESNPEREKERQRKKYLRTKAQNNE